MDERERSITTVVLDPCDYCGSEVTWILDCDPPDASRLRQKPYSEQCVAAPRWRWCPRVGFFAAWLGASMPPQDLNWTPFSTGRR